MKCKKTILIVFLNILNYLFLFKSYKTKNNESEDRIEELTNEMKALLYRYNNIINRKDKNIYDGPVPKLRKNRVLEFKKLFLYGIIL